MVLNNKIKAVFEMFILVSAIFAVAYILREGYNQDGNGKENIGGINNFIKAYELIINYLTGDNLVSALSVSTCLRSKIGEICQQYESSDCASKCDGDCIPAKIENVADCAIGTCYNSVEGTCQAGSPKYTCLALNGQWFDDKYGNNVAQCKQGCCILGGNSDIASLATEQKCNKMASSLGVSKQFKSNVQDDLSCRALASVQPEGACVFVSGGITSCKFIKQNECTKLKGSFSLNTLCSNPNLKTGCAKQTSTDCHNGKVYWYDSCGNRENIYEMPKTRSDNNGMLLSPDLSCVVSSSNRNSCGNCDYFQGTKCGLKSSGESVLVGNYICKDLSCIDENGNKRDNGESWCVYQGAIGLDESKNRGADTPGSRDFRKSCINGEIASEPCQDYRNQICVEDRINKQSGGQIATAACRTNLWQTCLQYNQGKDVSSEMQDAVYNSGESESLSESAKSAKVSDLCAKNPDCFMKNVNVADNFAFSMCLPKYNPGFDTKDYGETANALCKLGSRSCTISFVKEFDIGDLFNSGGARWNCVSNCQCLTDSFATQMNDMCISLGDCGTKANYIGELTENAKITKDKGAPINDHTPTLTAEYLKDVKKYSDKIPGQYAKPEWEGYSSVLGIDAGQLSGSYNMSDPSDFGMAGTLIPGVIGIAAFAALKYTGVVVTAAKVGAIQSLSGSTVGGSAGISPALAGAGGAIAGAAIGFVVTSMLIKYTGIGSGLGEELTYALIGVGTAAGAIIGANVALTSSGALGASGGLFGGGIGGASAGLALAATIAWVVIAVVVIFVVTMMLLGIGDSETVKVSFDCQPWEAPLGGNQCGKCGEGQACSRYQCHQLGQTCEFINEGSGNETCVNINPKDVSAPIIGFIPGSTSTGFNYINQDGGVRIEGSNEKCATAFSLMSFGIQLNEPGTCRLDTVGSKSYKDMQYSFGGNSLFMINHTLAFPVPSLESLGYNSIGENKQANITLYVKCMDYSGNKNEKPYSINFCVKPGLDVTEPVVVAREPALGYSKYGTTKQNVTIYLNEPSNCKWDLDDLTYDSMSNTFNCGTRYNDLTSLGWPCSGVIPLDRNEKTYYIRCADQPWFAENNESKRNKNSKSYQLVLKRTTSDLKIDSVNVENATIKGGSSPVTVEVAVKTSGGYDGSAKCAYSFGGNYVDFFNTFSSNSKQVFELTSGDKTINIVCIDPVGNSATRTANFRVEVDKNAPKITRVYDSSGNLIVVTNENAECRYINNDNGCDLTNSTLMNGNQLTHSLPFNRNNIYWIGCADQFGNKNDECLIVRGGIIS